MNFFRSTLSAVIYENIVHAKTFLWHSEKIIYPTVSKNLHNRVTLCAYPLASNLQIFECENFAITHS